MVAPLLGEPCGPCSGRGSRGAQGGNAKSGGLEFSGGGGWDLLSPNSFRGPCAACGSRPSMRSLKAAWERRVQGGIGNSDARPLGASMSCKWKRMVSGRCDHVPLYCLRQIDHHDGLRRNSENTRRVWLIRTSDFKRVARRVQGTIL